MAEEGDSGEKTEAPSGKRLSQSRSQGMVGQSAELSQVVGMTAAFYALIYVMPHLWQSIQTLVKNCLTSQYSTIPWTVSALQAQFFSLTLLIMPKLLLMMTLAALFGAGCTLLQTKFLWSWQIVKPKLYTINPLAGFKRIFSLTNYLNLLKSIAKLAIIGPIAYSAFFQNFPAFLRMMDVPFQELLPLTATMAGGIFLSIMKLMFLLAILDAIWQRYRTSKRLKMSKQEVKDEAKASEGDEGVRKKIIAIGLQRARERMMKAVPTADVVVTNPTHISVALAYSAEAGAAPRVVAKGQGHVALRIREIAARHGVPIVERKPLARALYKMVEVNNEIPYELFKAVAEILAYVYRLKGRNPLKKKNTSNNPQARRLKARNRTK